MVTFLSFSLSSRSSGEEAREHGSSFGADHEWALLRTRADEWRASRELAQRHLVVRRAHRLRRRQQRAEVLAQCGGSPGSWTCPRTGLPLPILVGTVAPDPAGSGVDAPVVGIAKNHVTGELRPLLGATECPESAAVVPIRLGADGIDATTGRTGKVGLSPLGGVICLNISFCFICFFFICFVLFGLNHLRLNLPNLKCRIFLKCYIGVLH